MKSILLTTNHPAPYIDEWVKILRKEYEVDVVYRKRLHDDVLRRPN